MATISKFYLHDAATPNTGTMPSGAFLNTNDSSGDATGAQTARAADDTKGASQQAATITSNAVTTSQRWGFRRFVTPPLAAVTLQSSDGNWTFSYARSESNLLHNMAPQVFVYGWRPSTGLVVGVPSTDHLQIIGTEPTVAATEQAESVTTSWAASHPLTLADGDILVIEVADVFIQGMATAYTATFNYDGATEASATDCASFVTPPVALTLFGAAAAVLPPKQTVVGQAVQRAATRCWKRRPSGIVVPRLWTPEVA